MDIEVNESIFRHNQESGRNLECRDASSTSCRISKSGFSAALLCVIVYSATHTRSFASKLHIVSTTLVIIVAMGLLDGYLVEQNHGNRRTGVFVMLLIGDVCLLLVLRYIALWVGAEVQTTNRGSSMAEWFLFIFILDIKVYFILEGVRKNCAPAGLIANAMPLQSSSNFYDSIQATSDEPHNGKEKSGIAPIINYLSSAPMHCEYSLLARKALTLVQAILMAGLYILLVGADHIKNLPNFRELEELKMRVFWVVVDLLDILELQSSMWELNQGQIPYLIVGFVYFYCYIVLIILPPISLTEMSKKEGDLEPHEMLIYLITSLCMVNVGATIIRLVLLFRHNFAATSAVFIGKDVICLGMKIMKLIQIRLIDTGKLKFEQHLDGGTNDRCRNPLGSEGSPVGSDVTYKCNEINEDGAGCDSLCAKHSLQDPTGHERWGDCTSVQKSMEYVGNCECKVENITSDSSTTANITSSSICDTADGFVTSLPTYEDEKARFENQLCEKRVKFNSGQRKIKVDRMKELGIYSLASNSNIVANNTSFARNQEKTKTSSEILSPNIESQAEYSLSTLVSNDVPSKTFGTQHNRAVLSPSLFLNLNNQDSMVKIDKNRHSCVIVSSTANFPATTSYSSNNRAISAQYSSKSLSDVTKVAASTSCEFPPHPSSLSHEHPMKILACKDNAARNILYQRSSSETDQSDFEPPPPSMELLNQEKHSCSRYSLTLSDTASTSV